MYLSQLILNPRSKAVRRDLADCEDMHRTIMSAFPNTAEERARQRYSVLFRLERAAVGNPIVLVQSSVAPKWSSLDPDYLVSPPRCNGVHQSIAALMEGQVLMFRLLANPTKRILSPSGCPNGIRVELRGEEQWLAWLRRKESQHGFELLSAESNPDVLNVRASPRGKVLGSKLLQPGNGHQEIRSRVTVFGVQFDGQLRVIDRARFVATLRAGIGPGKAYGMGLLSVARRSTS